MLSHFIWHCIILSFILLSIVLYLLYPDLFGPCAISHEPLNIDDRLVNELLYVWPWTAPGWGSVGTPRRNCFFMGISWEQTKIDTWHYSASYWLFVTRLKLSICDLLNFVTRGPETQRALRVFCENVSWFLGLLVSKFLDFKASWFRCFFVSWFLGRKVARILDFLVSWFLDVLVS